MFKPNFFRMERSITTQLEKEVPPPWAVTWYIDLGWNIYRDNYLSFLRLFTERVRRFTIDLDDFQGEDDLKVLRSPFVTGLRLEGTPQETCRLQEFFPNIKMLDFGCDEASAVVVPSGVVMTLDSVAQCGDVASAWTNLREIRVLPHHMKSMTCGTCAKMENITDLQVNIRDVEDVTWLLSGFDHVKVLTITCNVEKYMCTPTVELIASRIASSWKKLTVVKLREAANHPSHRTAELLEKGIRSTGGIKVIRIVP